MLKRLLLTVLLAAAGYSSAAEGPAKLKPGFNLFSKEQDVKLGKEAAAEVEKQMVIVQNDALQNYVKTVASKLWTQPEADNYPYSMKVVNEPSINAFALPGGPMFVHTGLIAAADNEGQMAGVLAHEIAHVALRHGTNQVSKSNLIQLPAMLGGSMAGGSGSMLGQLAQLGIGLGANSLLLKYSRNAERDADLLGTRMMAKAGYNPVEMARFFEKLDAEGGSRGSQFFASHPNPGNRVKAVEKEITYLPKAQYNTSTGQFDSMKQAVKQLAPPPKKPGAEGAQPSSGDIKPSGSFKNADGAYFTISHPDNWEVFSSQSSPEVLIAPRGGVGKGQDGQAMIGAGFMLNVHKPESGQVSLKQSTEELVRSLVSSNKDMRVESSKSVRWNDEEAMLVRMQSPSPFQGQTEVDTLMTFARPQGLLYLLMITPQGAEKDLQPAFDAMVKSLRWK